MVINHGAVVRRALRQGLRVLAQYQAVNHVVLGPYMPEVQRLRTKSLVGLFICLYFLMKSLIFFYTI